jgi:pimeloyl-ACP methyl ester carboxylesterase
MIHGLGSASSSWFPAAAHHPRLQQHRALLVDLLGFGYSDRPVEHDYTLESHAADLSELLDHLSCGASVVLGHSMGGSIGLLLARRRPELVSQLILAEGKLDPGAGLISSRIVSVSERAFVTQKQPMLVKQLQEAGYHDFAGTVRAADPTALHRSAVSLIAVRTPSLREQLYRLRMPRTFLFAERTLPHPDTRRLPTHGVRVHVLPNAGHDMMLDHPEGFAVSVADAAGLS